MKYFLTTLIMAFSDIITGQSSDKIEVDSVVYLTDKQGKLF